MIKTQLFAMGTQRELLSTQLTYYRIANSKTGRSGPIPMGGLVTLAFASGDGDDRLLRWITHSPEGELCTLTKARIAFYAGDLDGSKLFEYQLHDAALVYWKEEFKATGTTPMTVTMTISAAIQTIKGITWIKPWRESRVLSEEIATHKEGVQRGVSDDHGKEKDGSALEGVVLEVGAKGETQSTKAFKHSFNYHSRIRARALKDPVAHNFPYSFDDFILKIKPITQADGSLLYRHAGHLNGKSGFFEIGLNPQTKTIFHRTFAGDKR